MNGCDHDTATQRALAQVDGSSTGPGVFDPGYSLKRPLNCCAITSLFPAPTRREISVDGPHCAMGRGSRRRGDLDFGYLRYRPADATTPLRCRRPCTRLTAIQLLKPAWCSAPDYVKYTPASVPGAGGTFAAELRRTSGSCEWLALSELPWISLARPITGGDRSVLTYNVAANTGAARSGWIRFVYPGGLSYLEVRQGAPSGVVGFHF